MPYPVKFFFSTMENAPVVDTNWGAMVAMLDACLVNGFNQKTVASMIRVGSEVTVTITAGHNYLVDQILVISGATQVDYNTEVKIKSITATTLKFDITSSPVSPATTTSSITIKVAPLGFDKPFAGTNLGVYRSKTGNRNYLRVDNSQHNEWAAGNSITARVQCGENMTDANTFIGARAPFDVTDPLANNGRGQYKWYQARNSGYEDSGSTYQTGARSWVLIGDDRGFYYFPAFDTGNASIDWKKKVSYLFTEFDSFKSGDVYNTLLYVFNPKSESARKRGYQGSYSYENHPSIAYFNGLDPDIMNGAVLLRDHTQQGGNTVAVNTSLGTSVTGNLISGVSTGLPFPNGPDNSLVLHPTYIKQVNFANATSGLRGILPGTYCIHNDNAYSDLTIIDNIVGFVGKKFLIIETGYSGSSTSKIAFDITGPWR